PSYLLEILGGRDRWNERVDGRPNQPHPALTGWVPVEDPVSSSLDDVEGLTRTDDCDGGQVRSAVRQALRRDVDDLYSVIPLRVRPGKIRVHPAEVRGQPVARTVGEDGNQVDIADIDVEVAHAQGAEQVETHQGRSANGLDRLADRNQ